MSEEKIYYKVVKSQDCLRTSIIDVGKYICKYNIRKWTFPEVGKIFVTSCLKAAIRTAEYFLKSQLPGDDADYEVWKVRVRKPRELKYIAINTKEKDIEEFWNRKDERWPSNAVLLLYSPNTYGCSAVKLEKLMRIEFGSSLVIKDV